MCVCAVLLCAVVLTWFIICSHRQERHFQLITEFVIYIQSHQYRLPQPCME